MVKNLLIEYFRKRISLWRENVVLQREEYKGSSIVGTYVSDENWDEEGYELSHTNGKGNMQFGVRADQTSGIVDK